MIRKGRSRTHAQAIVEFALVLPIFLLILFGIIDAGRLIVTYNTLANSARSAARVAIVNQSTAGTDTCDTLSATAWPVGCGVVAGSAAGVEEADILLTYLNPTDTGPCVTLKIGCIVQVDVSGHFEALTPFIGQLIGPIDLTSTTKMPIENVCSNPPPAPLVQC
ncbi:MAG TPA: TadE family protein [Candidatus Limnocylindrales bacterium]|nr:TadE family protein [Candidatus Limnocylindrales bacterium]